MNGLIKLMRQEEHIQDKQRKIRWISYTLKNTYSLPLVTTRKNYLLLIFRIKAMRVNCLSLNAGVVLLITQTYEFYAEVSSVQESWATAQIVVKSMER